MKNKSKNKSKSLSGLIKWALIGFLIGGPGSLLILVIAFMGLVPGVIFQVIFPFFFLFQDTSIILTAFMNGGIYAFIALLIKSLKDFQQKNKN